MSSRSLAQMGEVGQEIPEAREYLVALRFAWRNASRWSDPIQSGYAASGLHAMIVRQRNEH